MDPVLVDRRIERAMNLNEVPVNSSCSLIICYGLFSCVLLQLLSLSLIISFIILFSDKDSGIYDHTDLGICFLIDFILLFICMCILFLAIITKNNDHWILILAGIVFPIALLAGIVFCIWGIVVLAKKDYTFITFTHIVLILSVGYYGAYFLLGGGMTVANQIDCCKRPLC